MKLKKTIALIVDDTPAVIDVVREALEAQGFAVSVATSGEQALRQARLLKPAVILLDIIMPGMDGYETCRRLKAGRATSQIPVIFLTARNESFDKVRGFGYGAVDYLVKPVDLDELLARIRTHLETHRLRNELADLNASLQKRIARQVGEILNSQESERQRIARDLHDGVGQTLVMALIYFRESRKNPGEAEEYWNRGIDFLSAANRDLRDICRNLYPSVLRDLGLEAAIRWLENNLLRVNGITTDLHIDSSEDVPEEVKINLYRIIQEAFANIVKHAEADRVQVSLRVVSVDDIRLSIRDNGIGFRRGRRKKSGIGLATMEQRCESIGCRLAIDAAPNRGTTIDIRSLTQN